jgi:hypothetical protein
LNYASFLVFVDTAVANRLTYAYNNAVLGKPNTYARTEIVYQGDHYRVTSSALTSVPPTF